MQVRRRPHARPARVAGARPDRDLAVVSADTGDVAPVEWARRQRPGIGTAVVALANPGGRGLRVTLGFVVRRPELPRAARAPHRADASSTPPRCRAARRAARWSTRTDACSASTRSASKAGSILAIAADADAARARRRRSRAARRPRAATPRRRARAAARGAPAAPRRRAARAGRPARPRRRRRRPGRARRDRAGRPDRRRPAAPSIGDRRPLRGRLDGASPGARPASSSSSAGRTSGRCEVTPGSTERGRRAARRSTPIRGLVVGVAERALAVGRQPARDAPHAAAASSRPAPAAPSS